MLIILWINNFNWPKNRASKSNLRSYVKRPWIECVVFIKWMEKFQNIRPEKTHMEKLLVFFHINKKVK